MTHASRAIEILDEMNACSSALDWMKGNAGPNVGLGPAGRRLWLACPRPDWLIWVLTRKKVREHIPEHEVVFRYLIADLMETVLPILKGVDLSYVRDTINSVRLIGDGVMGPNEQWARMRGTYGWGPKVQGAVTLATSHELMRMVVHSIGARAHIGVEAVQEATLQALYYGTTKAKPDLWWDQCEIIHKHVSWAELRRALKAGEQ